MRDDRFRISDIVEECGFDGAYWVRIVDQPDDAIRKYLAYDHLKKTYPPQAMAFFKWFADKRREGDKRATAKSAMLLLSEWQKAHDIGAPVEEELVYPHGKPDAEAGALMLPEPLTDRDHALAQLNAGETAKAIAVVLKGEAIPRPQATPNRLLTAQQAAEIINCHPRSVARYVKPVQLGSQRRFKESDVYDFVNAL